MYVTQNETYAFECSSEGAIPSVDFQWILGTQVEVVNYLWDNVYFRSYPIIMVYF